MHLGLRIDVDTYRGTKLGVPKLCDILAQRGMRGTFFFSVGPDNMGRHLWRLLRPAFLRKMLRTRAASLYGWDILLRGTLWPGPVIGHRLAEVIRACATAGHEIGLHAWDHHAWQNHVQHWPNDKIKSVLQRGYSLLTEILGQPPVCSAAPAWRCTGQVLRQKLSYAFTYNSDCRGDHIFLPKIDNEVMPQPQIPTTLPTYDEAMGRDHVSRSNYNEWLMAQLRPGLLNVLTIHAEVEGIAGADLFESFLDQTASRATTCFPLGELLQNQPRPLPVSSIVASTVPGREGWIACQLAEA
jgi:undecaprenyl phosphate-alpha-L-ara4FN deformylase